MGEPKNPNFYDFGTLGRVPGSPNTSGYHTHSKKNRKSFYKLRIMFINVNILEIWNFEIVEKTGAEKSRIFV